MNKKPYSSPQTCIVLLGGEAVMTDGFNTQVSDTAISQEDIGAKRGQFPQDADMTFDENAFDD